MAKSSKKQKRVPQNVTFSDDDGSMEEETLDFDDDSDYGKENADSDGEDDDHAVFDDDDVEGDSDDYQEDIDANSEDDDDEPERDEVEGDGIDMQNDERKDAEMEELEKEYSNLHREEEDIWRNLRRHKDEDLLKGQAVKNQKALWDKALQFRFLLQKPFSNSNKLPQEPVRSVFQTSFDGVDESYSDLIISTKKTLDSLLQLQEALMEKNPSITQAPHADLPMDRSLNEEEDEEWFRISQMQSRMASFRDKSVDKWQRRTQVTSGAAGIKSKFQAFNQNISEQVASYMRDPSRMIKGMQQRKSAVPIFGHGPDSIQNNKDEVLQNDGDPDLLDDSEFYQHLLKEFLETFDSASSEIAFYALKRLQTKKRKIVDRRASKSRKIRYNVHEKIVNFMAPQPMNIPPMAPKLFEDLFGLKSQKANSVA